MKLNWFSPLPPAKTEIANHTARILPLLAARAEVTLWTDQSQWDPALAEHAVVRPYQPQQVSWAELNRGQLSFYNIGNNVRYHSTIWQIARQHPGVVILHDLCLQHLFAGLFLHERQDREGYVEQMARYYGPEGMRAARDLLGGRLSMDYMASVYPLTPLALQSAMGVLVHTRPGLETLQEGPWPAAYCPLPYPATPCLGDKSEKGDSPHLPERPGGGHHARMVVAQLGTVPFLRSGARPYRLIVFGHIGSNRRLDALLESLAGLAEREAFRLDVYGDLFAPDQFRARVRELALSKLVTLHGFVPDEVLDRALRSAHLAVNLRFPTMGEASASQLRIWDHALPSLVTEVGWYASLPQDTAALVRPDHEIQDIQGHLRAFLSDPARYAEIGQNGRRHLEKDHTPESYVAAILDFARDTAGLRNRALASHLVARAGAEMAPWTDPERSEEVFRRVAEEISALVL
jgi:glycosyltransferase involved in cell wall biosynthesis